MGVDLSQFFQVFFDESAEHLEEMERIFLTIDLHHAGDEELNAAFRAAHSIKGGAATFGFPDMAQVTHTLETLLDQVRHRERQLTAEMVEIFLEAGDAISMQLSGHRDATPVDQSKIETVCAKLQELSAQQHTPLPAAAPEITPAMSPGAATQQHLHITLTPTPEFFTRMVRLEPLFEELSTMGELTVQAHIHVLDTLDSYDPEACLTSWELDLLTTASSDEVRDIFMFAVDDDELVIDSVSPAACPGATAPTSETATETAISSAAQLNLGRRMYDKSEQQAGAYGRRTGEQSEASSIRVGVSKVDQLINLVGELVITQAMLAQTSLQFDPVLHERLHHGLALLERNTRDLQDSVMSIRMMPISCIFSRFPRMVHDLATTLHKQVELRFVGEATELDKGLIEKLADPLTHLVRNSLDHGIELPDVRVAAHKPACGTITMKAYQQGGRIIVEVIDDGAGLNRVRILAKAAANGVPVSETMTDEEVWQLIFAPGFSTAEQVTDVSGRGVGMDVVMRNVQAMGGRVTLHSTEGSGSRVIISLPLTLAILDGLSVRVGAETFIIPLNSITESIQPAADDISAIGGSHSTVRIRGNYLPLMRLDRIFTIANGVQQPEQGVVILVDVEGQQLALLVDELLSQHQVVIKSLETNYRRVDGTSGATILGDGKVALILDTAALVQLWKSS